MDSETCSFLFKRWSDDYANCQRLQQELATLRQQHEDLLRQLQALQLEREQCARLHTLPAPTSPVQPPNQAAIEAGLQRWPEYLNLKEQLHASVEHNQRLTNENSELHSALQRHEEQAANDTRSISVLTERVQELTLANTNLSQDRDRITQQYEDVKLKYDDLQRIAKLLYDADVRLEEYADKAAKQFESLKPNIEKVQAAAAKYAKYEEYEANHKQVVVSYEKQIQDLKQLLETKEAENKEIHDELTNVRDALQKARESKKSLVSKLQVTILPKLGPSGDANHSQKNTPQHHARQPSTSTTSTLRVPTETNEATTSGQKSPNDKKTDDGQAEEQEKVDSANMKPAEKPSDLTPMPAQRRREFAGISLICPNVGDFGEKGLFEREFLKNTIGGAVQALIVRSVYGTHDEPPVDSKLPSVANSQTALAKAREITTYLCPGLDHNPWCPSTPGEHGYMFIGLGREKDTFLEPQNFNVFVGLLKNKSSERRKYRYIGVYCAVRVAPLTVDEWATLSEFVKETYVSRTKEKTNDPRTLIQIRTAYDSGELTVPCVKLECVAYDEVLFTSLVAANSKPVERQSPAKRRRASNADSVHGSHRKRVTLLVNS